MRVTFVSTYPPRKCGIATYTRDLAEEMKRLGTDVKVVAIDTKNLKLSYPKEVTSTIEKEQKTDYLNAAKLINSSNTDIVHIQEEFGIFGGTDGEWILDLAKELIKPFIVTFHTILTTPSPNQERIMQELNRLGRGVVVMKEIGKDRLLNIYGMNERDVSVIFHGVPTIDGIDREKVRKDLDLTDKFVIMSSNLISHHKGLEFVIQAMPTILKKIPHAIFLIIGETHPDVKAREGEVYRETLEKLVKDLKLEKSVRFVNKYLPLNILTQYFAASDIFVTPYLEPQQITSGTLSYALGAGKVCISTSYIYAKNVLKNNQGILVPFKDYKSISKAIIDVYTHPDKKQQIERNAHKAGRKMRWSVVAKKHLALYQQILKEESKLEKEVIKFLKGPVSTNYLLSITDTVGMAQHTYNGIPSLQHGYSTDDNARALIVASLLSCGYTSKKIFTVTREYLGYLFYAQEKNGKFHTFLGADNKWLDTEEVNDAYAKAVWGLGVYLANCPTSPFAVSADTILRKTLPSIKEISTLRTAAFAILGLAPYAKKFEDEKDSAEEAYENTIFLADLIVNLYKKNYEKDWEWFETTVTYDNFRIPQALFWAYKLTRNKVYKDVAERSLNFLLEKNYNKESRYFDFIGQNGWLVKGKSRALFDQQPLEAAAAVSALVFAYKITKKELYKKKAFEAFEWFFGRNRNHATMLDKVTGGVYDGLTRTGVNENQGSESIICFMIAQIELRKNFI